MFLSCMRSIRAGNRTVLRVFSFAMKSFWMVITDGHYTCNTKTWKKNIIISTLLGGISRETITYSFEVVNTEDAEKLNVHDNRVECLAVLYFNKLSNFLRKTISSFRVYFEIHLLNIIKISEWLVNFQSIIQYVEFNVISKKMLFKLSTTDTRNFFSFHIYLSTQLNEISVFTITITNANLRNNMETSLTYNYHLTW